MAAALMGRAAAIAGTTAPVAACASSRPPTATSARPTSAEVLAVVDLPQDDPRSVELSDVVWDETTATLYAVSDRAPRVVPLHPGPGFRTWTFGPTIAVHAPGSWDAEGIAIADGGFYVANERGPHVYRVDLGGRIVAELPLPARFREARTNRSLESLTVSPDRRYLFVANEAALHDDGSPGDAHEGTAVRILRHDLATGAQDAVAYRTDPVFARGEHGATGVSAMAALSGTGLLVMERAYVPRVGNAVRVYRVAFGGANVVDLEHLHEHTPALRKVLVVDLAALPDRGAPPPREPEPTRLLANFEGLAVGPALPRGRRVLFLLSDNNGDPRQPTRIIVLAVAL